MSSLAQVLCQSQEFAELPVRHNEDLLNMQLAAELPWPVDPSSLQSAHTKAFLLLQAQIHSTSVKLPISDYINDTRSLLDQVPRVAGAMLEVAVLSAPFGGVVRGLLALGALLVQGQGLGALRAVAAASAPAARAGNGAGAGAGGGGGSRAAQGQSGVGLTQLPHVSAAAAAASNQSLRGLVLATAGVPDAAALAAVAQALPGLAQQQRQAVLRALRSFAAPAVRSVGVSAALAAAAPAAGTGEGAVSGAGSAAAPSQATLARTLQAAPVPAPLAPCASGQAPQLQWARPALSPGSDTSVVDFVIVVELKGGGSGSGSGSGGGSGGGLPAVHGRSHKPKPAAWTAMLSLCADEASDGLVLAVKRFQPQTHHGQQGQGQGQGQTTTVTLTVPASWLQVPVPSQSQSQSQAQAQAAPGLYLDVMCDSVLGLDCRVRVQ